MRIASGLCAALMLVGPVAARPQDLVAVAPKAAKVEYEDARIRVVRLRIAPRETLPMHDRPSRVVIPLTLNDVTSTRPDGVSHEVRAEAGKPAWSEPAKRSITNHDTAVENIVVEFKQPLAPAKPLAEPPNPRPAGFIEDKSHRWLFENQYVRVYEDRIPPGEMTDFHRHTLDSVEVFLSAATTAGQLEGQEWGKDKMHEPGAVAFDNFSKHPITHRGRNDGKSEFRVILVQFLQ